MRKAVAAVALMLFAFGVAMAEDFGGIIKKVDGNKVTITKMKKGEKGDDITVTATDSVKVVKGTFNKETKKFEAGDALTGGLKNEAVKEGAFVRATTNDDGKLIELRVGEPRKKKDN